MELSFFTLAASGALLCIKTLRITSRSGDEMIDEAVQSGFRRATICSATKADFSGIYFYRFD